MLGNTFDAEDALQEIFIKVFDNLNSYKATTNFSAWIYRISYNYCVNFLGRKKLFSFLPLLEGIYKDTANREDSFLDTEYGKELNSALEKLSKIDRTILVLRCVEDKEYDEISEVVDLKPANVRKRYERARKKLKAMLENTLVKGNDNYLDHFETANNDILESKLKK
jgi:RNA polymerase sigma-70 factor (ECF subfamily)